MFFLWGHDHLGVAIDSAVSNMAGSLCLCRDLAFVLAQNGAAQHPWSQRWSEITVRASPSGVLTPQALRSRRGYRWFGLGPLLSGVPHPFPSVPPLMTRCRSLHRRASPLSPGMTTRLRCPFGCGSVVRARPRDDGYAFRAAENVGLCGILHRVPTLLGWTSGFSGGVALVFSTPLRCILSGSAWGAYKVMEGTFYCPK